MKSLSRVRLLATPWTAAHQAPPSMGFSRQECWSGAPSPFPTGMLHLSRMMDQAWHVMEPGKLHELDRYIKCTPTDLWQSLTLFFFHQCFYSCAFSRMLFSWNCILGSLFRLASFTKQYIFKIPPSFCGLTAGFFLIPEEYSVVHTCHSLFIH